MVRPMNHPWLARAAAALAVALLLIGAHSRDWLRGANFGIETRLGLRAMELCQWVEPEPGAGERACETVPLAEMATARFAVDGTARYATLAALSYWGGLACALLLALCLALSFATRPLRAPVHPTTLAILAALVALSAAALTLALNPFTRLSGWGSGGGFVLYGGGAGLALFASILLGRARPRPVDDW